MKKKTFDEILEKKIKVEISLGDINEICCALMCVNNWNDADKFTECALANRLYDIFGEAFNEEMH